MLYWSLKALLAEPVRLISSALAVAVSFILVIFFSAVFEGESDQMVVYLEKMQADVWVMQKGVSNMHMASSMVWEWKAEKIAQMPEVQDVSAILYLNGPVKISGKDWFSYIIGLQAQYQRAGPWELAQGKAMPGPGEAVIPETISKLTGIQLGDEITMIDRPLRVVGLSRGTFSMASSVVFVSHEDLGDLVEGSDQLSYIMVYAKPDVDASELVLRIKEEVDKVNAMTSEAFIASDWQLAVQMGAEIIRMMTSIGTLLAMMIVAFTTYSLVTRKRQELAVAKALGFGNVQLCLATLMQSLVITLLGFCFALLMSFILLPLLPLAMPQINLSVRLHQFVPVLVVVVPVAMLASFGAAMSVIRVDPMTVFTR